MDNSFMSQTIVDVSSDPVIKYCESLGTIRQVIGPLWPKKRYLKNGNNIDSDNF